MFTATALCLSLLVTQTSAPSQPPLPADPPAPSAATLTQPPPPPAVPPSAASLPRGTHREKSVSFFVVGGELLVGTAAGYIGLLIGVLANISKGGLSTPPDLNDVMLLGVLPGGLAAAGSWTVGLVDFRQRNVFTSALFALVGAAVGELAGFGIGTLVGNAAFRDDSSAASLVALAFGPLFAALGATICMELFKSGREVEDEEPSGNVAASMTLLKQRDGGFAPAMVFAGRF